MMFLRSLILYSHCVVFFFKQKTAYDVRISDWSSDVCSSDLAVQPAPQQPFAAAPPDLHLVRQREGEFGDARIEKGRAAFDAMRHQAAVELAQEIVRQPVGDVGRLRHLQPAAPLNSGGDRKSTRLNSSH